jgi:ubiquinone/menaquinone biosynthesis C-methylase UbiE
MVDTSSSEADYYLGYSSMEQQRLRRQAEELAGESAALLDGIGVSPGWTALDIACGPQGCLDLLSERVGTTGSVVGIELNAEAVELATRFVADRGLTNVDVRQGDARSTGLPKRSFDLVMARLVLVVVPKPEEIVAEAVSLVRPGGVVAFHEADFITCVCDPALPEWDRLYQAMVAYGQASGTDPFLGRRLPRMLSAAGVTDIHVTPLAHAYLDGHTRRATFVHFAHNLHDRLLASGLMSDDEFVHCVAAVGCHLDDPGTTVFSHLFIQAWGRVG